MQFQFPFNPLKSKQNAIVHTINSLLHVLKVNWKTKTLIMATNSVGEVNLHMFIT